MDTKNFLESQIVNLPFLEEIYHHYQKGDQIDPSWFPLFQKLKDAEIFNAQPSASFSSQEDRIRRLRDAFRFFGHLLVFLNPIQVEKHQEISLFQLENLGFNPQEKETAFPTLGLLEQKEAPLNEIFAVLKKRYGEKAGFEFKGLVSPEIEKWIQEEIEKGRFDSSLTIEEKLVLLEFLTKAEILETFLHTKHVGKKRFSLEGAETLIPMLGFINAHAAEEGVEEIVMGMSHRGRLNVLANILNKPIDSILKDFDEEYEPFPSEGMGDVRYHKGHASDFVDTYKGKSIKLTITSNPSHLESINPVVEGQVHAKQFLMNDERERNHVIPLLMHGDAALSGQGIVYETLQMSKLSGFETGGTIHLVINNQIGFTTSPQEGRSTRYCTDIAKTFGSPVFHVNAEDPEMCVKIALFAFAIRQRFHCDVFIDLNGYRKYGHNEGDEPSFTQPLEYQIIRKKKSIRNLYVDQLLQEGVIKKDVVEKRQEVLKSHLQEAYQKSKENKQKTFHEPTATPFSFEAITTSVNFETLKEIGKKLSTFPENFHLHPKLDALFKKRAHVIEDQVIDWAAAEYLAYGSLVWEGIPVRIVGQDSARGTFSHRHALIVDQLDGKPYYPLAHLKEEPGRFEALNTCLSEAAALGFEYGYSVICDYGLTIWEAQYGDFANSAQVIIDQYIASGEQKWGQTSPLTLFLPHGLEGQGPEHSSARLERFLSLAGHDNMQIVNPTIPSQMFHLLRRQVKQQRKKPLIVFTPKELLRHPACISQIKDLTEGHFYSVLGDLNRRENTRSLVFCSGHIYYDLIEERERQKKEEIAIVRLEQLYPLDTEAIRQVIAECGEFQKCSWVQEEPENMGAWPFISKYLKEILGDKTPLLYIGRERSATPATGFYAKHKQEKKKILHEVFRL